MLNSKKISCKYIIQIQAKFQQKLFLKEFLEALIFLYFNEMENTLIVGLSSGVIYYYRLGDKYTFDMEEEFSILQTKISGCISVQREIYAIKSNFNNTKYQKFITNCIGKIYICQSSFVKIRRKIVTHTSKIKQLLIDNERNKLMVLNYDSKTYYYFNFDKDFNMDLRKQKQELSQKITYALNGPRKGERYLQKMKMEQYQFEMSKILTIFQGYFYNQMYLRLILKELTRFFGMKIIIALNCMR
ncbi:unnamed protein product [Paramecium sonneborni]|uniref:Uncharacterized protein n=1 Tax=Paramecium sonneborni TaxID=65129 RepID=A0A8S1MQV7_9CILI|nr:unnamed protein product [Paramecium sonneborni]